MADTILNGTWHKHMPSHGCGLFGNKQGHSFFIISFNFVKKKWEEEVLKPLPREGSQRTWKILFNQICVKTLWKQDPLVTYRGNMLSLGVLPEDDTVRCEQMIEFRVQQLKHLRKHIGDILETLSELWLTVVLLQFPAQMGKDIIIATLKGDVSTERNSLLHVVRFCAEWLFEYRLLFKPFMINLPEFNWTHLFFQSPEEHFEKPFHCYLYLLSFTLIFNHGNRLVNMDQSKLVK